MESRYVFCEKGKRKGRKIHTDVCLACKEECEIKGKLKKEKEEKQDGHDAARSKSRNKDR